LAQNLFLHLTMRRGLFCFGGLGLFAWLGLWPSTASSATYEVGPGKPLATISSVPWESLLAGDTVLIHWQAANYKEKWVICRQGTVSAPITIRGVPGPNGELPVIDGDGATTRTQLDFWGDTRGVIKIGGANRPADLTPKHIVIENLNVRSGRSPYTFRAASGITKTYTVNASSIYIEKGENITIRNCIINDSGNGFFVSSSDGQASRNILFEGNYVYDNGSSTELEHNIYTAAIGITFQYNRLGPLRAGCPGSNLKDRSAGQVVRYNWIEGGNKQMDMVDGADSILIRNDPGYRTTHVYGNIFIEPAGAGLPEMLRYGGDMGTPETYRKGTLYFYNNTVVSLRTDQTKIFKLSTADETCDARNNVFYTVGAGTTLYIGEANGTVNLSHNWLKQGFRNFTGIGSGRINNDGTNLTGTEPGFEDLAGQNFHLTTNSICINHGTNLPAAVLPAHNVVREYRKHQLSAPRVENLPLDIGALASPHGVTVNLAPQISIIGNRTVLEDKSTNATFMASDVDGPSPLSITASSSNTGLIANNSLIVTSSGNNYSVAIGPTANSNGTATVSIRASDGVTSVTNSFIVTVTAVNDAPSFTFTNAIVSVSEDAPLTYRSNFATAIIRGPSNESSQTVSFFVKTTNTAFFATAPAINSAGTLSFKPAANRTGSAIVTVYAQDSGGTLNGGKNVSVTNTFEISVVPVNDLPVISGLASKTVNEDGSTNITFKVTDVDGTIASLTATSSKDTLLPSSSLNPTLIGTNASLVMIPSPDANGSTTITLAATDNNGGRTAQTFSLTIRPVNDAPTFTVGTAPVVNMNSGAQTFAGWALPISKGAANESAQTLTFTLSHDNTNLFSTQPVLNTSTGNLTFTPKTNAVGKATVTAVLRDSGGTNYGGISAVTNKFSISVMRVAMRSSDMIVCGDIPGDTNGAVILVRTNGTQQTIGTNIPNPYAIARAGNGDLFVADYDAAIDDPELKRGAVYRLNAYTLARSTVATGGDLREPCGIVVEDDGNLLIADTEAFAVTNGQGGAIFRINPGTGSCTPVATNFSMLAGIAQNADGDVFVTDAGSKSVMRVDVASGEQTIVSADGFLQMPVGLVVDAANGDIIVADKTARSVIRINATSGVQSVIATGFEAPSHVAVSADGKILVTDGEGLPAIYELDLANGTTRPVAQSSALKQPKGLLVIP
jgi:hypothetical protein